MRIYTIKKALNIPEYKITEVISENETKVHLRLEPYKRKAFLCSGCGKIHKIGYHGSEETIVRDLSIFGKKTYLHVVKRRHVCPCDNHTHVEEVPWVKKWGRSTKRFSI